MANNANSTLRPELVWIDGRCYRFGESGAWSKDRGSASYQEESMYLNNDNCSDEDSAAAGEDEFDVQPEGGKFKHNFYVAKPFFPFLIGTKGSTRKRLEMETSTKIDIPRLGQDGNIVLVGPTRKKVISARNRLDNLIKVSRKKLFLTHFLSIPANDESIQSAFRVFKDTVLGTDVPGRGVDESIFQKSHKIHLTLGVLVLVDHVEREKAIRALEHCRDHIIAPVLEKTGPIAITLQGVDYMNDDPAEVSVLYAKVRDSDGILHGLTEKISEYYSEIGLLRTQNYKINLHATLMNTKFKNNDDWRRGKERETFDATRILKDHADTKFGEFIVNTIHISRFQSATNDKYYEATGKIDI